MATPAEKLADALDALHALQNKGLVAINTNDISTVYRQRLTKNGFLKEVLKGWYIPSILKKDLATAHPGMRNTGSFAAGLSVKNMVTVILFRRISHCNFIPVTRPFPLSW